MHRGGSRDSGRGDWGLYREIEYRGHCGVGMRVCIEGAGGRPPGQGMTFMSRAMRLLWCYSICHKRLTPSFLLL